MALFSQCLVFLITLITVISGQTYQDAYRLHQTLFTNYSKLIRPLQDQTAQIVISPSFAVISLVSLDERSQQIVINGFMGLRWRDEMLTWDPASYNGVSKIVPEQSIWKPRLVLLNTMEDRDPFEDDIYPLQLDYQGNIIWYPGGLFPALCKLDLRKFPLDEQKCALKMSPMQMLASEMDFNMTSSSVLYSLFVPNGEWDIAASSIRQEILNAGGFQYHSIDVELTLQRKPIFFIFNILFPVKFLGLLNVLTFMVPIEAGEKIGMSVTVLLAMAVYMGIVSDSLPSNSENMPYVTYYIFLLFALCVLSSIDNIIVVWLHHKECDEEKKQKRQSHIKSVSSKLRMMNNVFKKNINLSDTSKIVPIDVDEAPSIDTDKALVIDRKGDVEAMNPPNLSRRPGFGIPTSSFLNKKLSAGDCNKEEERYINCYKNLAFKLNYYSGIVFGVVTALTTVIIYIMLGS